MQTHSTVNVKMKNTVLLFSILFVFSLMGYGQGLPVVYQIDIKTEINPTSRIYLQKGMAEASALQAEAIIINLNTYGGTVVDADSMRSAILYSRIPVYVFIDNNAASAGALISIACQKIFMRKGASIGAATVVNESGEVVPDKYQSYMRSTMKTTAEAIGRDTLVQNGDTLVRWKRDPRIAEAMVDERIYIPNVIDSGKVLTLTALEAVDIGYCDGIVESVDEVITKYLGWPEYEIHVYKPALYDHLKGFLMNPFFQALLIMIIIAGIYFELQSPGFGFAGTAALLAAILYFAPLYLDGLAAYWEILLFIVGIILILVEIFAIPGFGITGISGICLIILGLLFSILDNDWFSFEQVTLPDFSSALMTVLSGGAFGMIATLFVSSRIGKPGVFNRIALEKDLGDAVSVAPQMNSLVGKSGIAATVLRPSGKIMIDNEIYDAVSEFEFIDKGCRVVVKRFENMQCYVERDN